MSDPTATSGGPSSRSERIALVRRATERAKATVKPGDWVQRRLCGGATGRFRFTHWDGFWMCGATVTDCAATNVFKLNGQPISFADPP